MSCGVLASKEMRRALIFGTIRSKGVAMKKTVAALLFLAIFATFCLAQEAEEKYPGQAGQQEEHVYIPQNLEECFAELENVFRPEELEEFRDQKEEDIIKYHHTLGMWIRNNWGLWSNSHLAEYFNSLGVYHPDDMSTIILKSFYRYLNNEDIKLDEQIKYYQDYWEKMKEEER
jgi:hypothetical protein